MAKNLILWLVIAVVLMSVFQSFTPNNGADAQTREAEIRASKIYISGRASCTSSICNYYSNLIQEKAAIIKVNL